MTVAEYFDGPRLVQNLTETQDIAICIIGDSMEDSGCDFCQFYGERVYCEDFDDDKCSHDGNLWASNDFGCPYTCTAHTFPMEQSGYEFVAV